MAVPLKRSIATDIGIPRPPPLLTSSAHTFTVSPSPKVLFVVEFANRITAPENENHIASLDTAYEVYLPQPIINL